MQAVKNSEIFSFFSNPTPLTFIMTYEGHRCLVTTSPTLCICLATGSFGYITKIAFDCGFQLNGNKRMDISLQFFCG